MKLTVVTTLMFLFALLVAGPVSLKAQSDSGGTVVLVKDPRIDQLVKKQSQINRVAVFKNSKGEYKGYRLMVKSTNDRTLAYKLKSDLLRYYPDQSVYMSYQSPYYKIKMGDFLKREDAEKLKKDLVSTYKDGIFVMQDIIRLKPEEEARLLKEEEEK